MKKTGQTEWTRAALQPVTKVTPHGSAAPRQKNRERTLADLQEALKTLQGSGQKVTLKAVADLAKVSPSLLNHRYTDFAEKVRGLVGRTIRQQRNEKADLLVAEREKNRQLRALVESQLVEITRLASVNEALRQDLAVQRAVAEGKVAKGSFGQKKPAQEP
jgi:AcrR family transcriptional regulator